MKRLILFALMEFCLFWVHSQTVSVFYPFTTDATDISGNAYNGTLSAGTTASSFLTIGNNATNYLTVPSAALTGLTNFSIDFKIRFTDFHTTGASPTNHIFSGSRSGCVQCFGFSYEKNALAWKLAFNGALLEWPDSSVAIKHWYCINLVRNGSNITLYKNGVSLGTNTFGDAINITSFVIGQEDDCIGGCFAANQSMWGRMDNFQVWNGLKTGCNFGGALAGDVDNFRVLEENNSEFEVYPNPAKGIFYIDYNGESDYTVKILNVSGEIIYLSENSEHQIDISKLKSGLYIILITNLKDQRMSVEKIIVE